MSSVLRLGALTAGQNTTYQSAIIFFENLIATKTKIKQQQEPRIHNRNYSLLQHACLLSKNNLVQKHHKSDDK